MKIYLLLLVTLSLVNCQSPEAGQKTPKITAPVEYVNTRIESEPPLRIPALEAAFRPGTKQDMLAAINKRRAMLGRLWQLSPILVPGPANSQVISPEVAHDRYLNFVTTYAADSILPLFQQRYARILLNEYHWLETGRADVIAYYVDQLLVAQSNDVQTIAGGLVRLKGKLPAPQYSSLLNRALPMAEERLAAEAHHLSELNYSLKKALPTLRPGTIEEQKLLFQQREIVRLKKMYTKDSISVAQLRFLPKPSLPAGS